jgi:hypothetical protein
MNRGGIGIAAAPGMAQEPMASGREEKKRARRAGARFWLPFAAMVVLFSGLAIAHAWNSEPGDATNPDAARHGREPTSKP